MNPADPEQSARFVALLTGLQSRLYAYLCVVLARADDARDVLQETNLVLWKKAADYDLARPFEPWAFRFAHWQAQAWRKRQSRDRLIFSDAVFEFVAGEASGAETAAEELQALEECLGKLPERSRALLEQRYHGGRSLQELAAAEGRPANALAALLYRARKLLGDCLEQSLTQPEIGR